MVTSTESATTIAKGSDEETTAMTTIAVNYEDRTTTVGLNNEEEAVSVTASSQTENDANSTTVLVTQKIQTPEVQEEMEAFKTTTIIMQRTGEAAIETATKMAEAKNLEGMATTEMRTTTTNEGTTATIEEKIPILPIIIVNEHERDEAGGSTQRPKSVGLAMPSREKSTESSIGDDAEATKEGIYYLLI